MARHGPEPSANGGTCGLDQLQPGAQGHGHRRRRGQLYAVVDRDLNTPGNWRAILNLKLKNLKTGAVTPRRFRPEDKVELAYLDRRPMQYLYKEGDGYVFMDKETYDQITLNAELAGE